MRKTFGNKVKKFQNYMDYQNITRNTNLIDTVKFYNKTLNLNFFIDFSQTISKLRPYRELLEEN